MDWKIALLALAPVALAAFWSSSRGADDAGDRAARLDEVYSKARGKFPNVAEISPAELREALPEGRYVLVDVRNEEEQAVSRIPGALTVEEFEERGDELRDRPVVTYCTIGYRSGMYADGLRRKGWDVRNLTGAILGWTHAGGPLVDPDGEPTKRVHVYGDRWDLAAEGYESTW